jgi:hypothetical protein
MGHLSRRTKGGAFEVEGLDEHLPPVFPGASSIVDSGLPRTCRGPAGRRLRPCRRNRHPAIPQHPNHLQVIIDIRYQYAIIPLSLARRRKKYSLVRASFFNSITSSESITTFNSFTSNSFRTLSLNGAHATLFFSIPSALFLSPWGCIPLPILHSLCTRAQALRDFLPRVSWGHLPRVTYSLRINTCKSVSKQTTLTPFRMNTYEKQGGGGVGQLFC